MFYLSLICFIRYASQFENDFCLQFLHGDQLRLDLRKRSTKIEPLSIGKKTSFSSAPFAVLKMISFCANIVVIRPSTKILNLAVGNVLSGGSFKLLF